MYIEQGYKGTIGMWKYLIIPVGFISFMVFNYILTINSSIDVEDAMRTMIEQLGSNIVLIILLAPLVMGLFVVLGWSFLVHQQSITSLTTSRKKIDWKRVFFAFGLWGGLTVLLTLIDVYTSPNDYVWNFDLTKFLSLAAIAIILIPLQTSFEEYLFRAHMMQGLGLWSKTRWVPLIVTSVLFGLMHLGNPEVGKLGYGIMIYYIGTGFFLGILTLMDEGLELALGFHAANNLITALLVTADWTAFQTHSIYKDISQPELGLDVLVPVLVVFPILLWVFARKYKWTNWKEKLFGMVMNKEQFVALQDDDSSAVSA
ncbi:MAG: CPBP family intramembrane metalloprotease [Croceitalea sp.]|nr:CPBP family intramembrane metalloprotease [Croceitalea sp.]MBT8239505.1 CPBP family intramembrane metalloprotease [Croceitalea sp.]NNC34132.1 CPBP family intramembrane metalloprotease [Croceitalea sp.]NNL08402.1 CPBP family intramembrane metalloprotease [Croceitalea sp.]NNM18693.1 CPBP family intramembrane metalloprotease [Croceitalea sp.]